MNPATDFLNDVGRFLESVRPWLTFGGVVGIIAILAKLYIGKRGADTAEKKVDAEVAAELRDDYAKEVAALRDERRRDNDSHRKEIESLKDSHRKDMQDMERRNLECDKDRDQLRDKVDALRDYADGLYRVILQNSAAGVIALGDFPSDEIRRAAEKVDSLFKPKGKDNGKPSR